MLEESNDTTFKSPSFWLQSLYFSPTLPTTDQAKLTAPASNESLGISDMLDNARLILEEIRGRNHIEERTQAGMELEAAAERKEETCYYGSDAHVKYCDNSLAV